MHDSYSEPIMPPPNRSKSRRTSRRRAASLPAGDPIEFHAEAFFFENLRRISVTLVHIARDSGGFEMTTDGGLEIGPGSDEARKDLPDSTVNR